jgi:hypothetical protein
MTTASRTEAAAIVATAIRDKGVVDIVDGGPAAIAELVLDALEGQFTLVKRPPLRAYKLSGDNLSIGKMMEGK